MTAINKDDFINQQAEDITIMKGVIEELEQKLSACQQEKAHLIKAKNDVYTERNMVLALAAKMAVGLGYQVILVKDGKEEGWWIVYINLPNGQVSWHVQTEELDWFIGAEIFVKNKEVFDGHTNEEKYKRVLDYLY